MNTTPDIITVLTPFLQTVGLPGAIALIVGYTLRKLCLWGRKFWFDHAWPAIDAIIQAYLRRQATMEACQKQLTESTIEIQQQVLTAVLRLEEKFPGLCKK